MRIDKILQGIKDKRLAITEQTFKNPPLDFDTFKHSHGIWTGLGEALRIIEEIIKDTTDD